MGFCILGGKENFLRKTISDKLTSLGQAIGIGATATQFANAIQSIYDTRYTAGQDSLKTARKLTLSSSQTGSNVDITDNWYTTVDASAVYSAGQTNARQGTAVAADVRSSKTFTNSSSSGLQGSMPDLSSSNFTTSWSSTTSGQASNFVVTANDNGYVAKNTTVKSTAAGTNSTAIATTAATGEQTLNITPGIYNKIKVNQTNAYNAGYNAGDIDGRASSKILSTYIFNSSHRRTSVTASVPSGTHTIIYWADSGSTGTAYMPTATITCGSTTYTFDPPNFPSGAWKSTSETTASTYYVEYSVTLSGTTSVSITLTPSNGDYNWPAIACFI